MPKRKVDADHDDVPIIVPALPLGLIKYTISNYMAHFQVIHDHDHWQ